MMGGNNRYGWLMRMIHGPTGVSVQMDEETASAISRVYRGKVRMGLFQMRARLWTRLCSKVQALKTTKQEDLQKEHLYEFPDGDLYPNDITLFKRNQDEQPFQENHQSRNELG